MHCLLRNLRCLNNLSTHTIARLSILWDVSSSHRLTQPECWRKWWWRYRTYVTPTSIWSWELCTWVSNRTMIAEWWLQFYLYPNMSCKLSTLQMESFVCIALNSTDFLTTSMKQSLIVFFLKNQILSEKCATLTNFVWLSTCVYFGADHIDFWALLMDTIRFISYNSPLFITFIFKPNNISISMYQFSRLILERPQRVRRSKRAICARHTPGRYEFIVSSVCRTNVCLTIQHWALWARSSHRDTSG